MNRQELNILIDDTLTPGPNPEFNPDDRIQPDEHRALEKIEMDYVDQQDAATYLTSKVYTDEVKNDLVVLINGIPFANKGSIKTSDPEPTEDGIYFFAESGTYTNFGGVVVDLTQGLVYGTKTGSNYTKTIIPINLSGYVAKTDFVPGKNKFNINAADVAIGYFVAYDTGALIASATYNTTGYIPVVPGQVLTMTFKHQVAFYNSNKAYVSGSNSTNTNKTITVPAGCYFMRCTVDKRFWDVFQIEEGSAITSYIEYGQRFADPYFFKVGGDNFWDATIGRNVLDFVKFNTGKNLFNKNAPGVALGNALIASSGIFSTNAGFNSTALIPVTAGLDYYFSTKRNVVWFDANQTYISGSDPSDLNKKQTAPPGAHYVRADVAVANWDTFQIEQSATGTPYEAYREDYYFDTVAAKLLQDRIVTPVKTNFLYPTKNLFNPNDPDVQDGKFVIYDTGLLGTNANYYASGYIPVTAGLQYYMSYKNSIAWYNASKVYISGSAATDTSLIQTAPAGAAYLRVSIIKTAYSQFMVALQSLGTSYVPYGYLLGLQDGTPIVSSQGVTGSDIQTALTVSISKPPTFAIAPKLYIPKNKELCIYYETIAKYYDEYKGKIDIVLTGAKITGRCAKFVQSTAGTYSATVNFLNEQFDTVATKTTTIEVVDPAVTTAVKILDIGDSYTIRQTYTDALMADSGTGVTLLGMRTSTATATPLLPTEGRSGYTLADYVTLQKTATKFSPFMQPVDPYKFYGVTGFWKLAKIGSPDAEHSNYATYVKNLFDAGTGYLVSPSTNDVVYDDTLAKFQVWNGTAWADISEATLAFTFNFAKYRSVWSIDLPNVVHILLGTNDFNGASETQTASLWPTWKTRMDTVIASIAADSASTKVIIGIPNSSGKQLEDGAAFYEKRKRAYWYHASKIIETYSGREAERIYVLDYHASIDRQQAFANTPELPFADFSGTATETFKSDATHLSPDGFKQMSRLFHGMIQKLR